MSGFLLGDAPDYLATTISEGAIPGAQVLVARRGQVLWHTAMGHSALDPEPLPLTLETRFDVASLTKALSTTTLAALLVGEGALDLEEPVEALWAATRGAEQGAITVRQLLAHASGLPAYRPYYLDLQKAAPECARREIVRRILAEPLETPPGTRQCYSDLDFILLGEWVARRAGRSLDQAFQQRIATPLGLGAGFRPLASASRHTFGGFAATERCPWRKEILCGAVHDDHAWLMGGVAGHAGLFATAGEVYAIAEQWLRAWHDRSSLLDSGTVRRFWKRFDESDPTQTWTLGWDTPSEEGSTAGTLFATPTVGHLGFTGTSVWIDISREIIVVLLTNRIHPTRDNPVLKTFRPAFHQRIMRALV